MKKHRYICAVFSWMTIPSSAWNYKLKDIIQKGMESCGYLHDRQVQRVLWRVVNDTILCQNSMKTGLFLHTNEKISQHRKLGWTFILTCL